TPQPTPTLTSRHCSHCRSSLLTPLLRYDLAILFHIPIQSDTRPYIFSVTFSTLNATCGLDTKSHTFVSSPTSSAFLVSVGAVPFSAIHFCLSFTFSTSLLLAFAVWLAVLVIR